MSLPINLALVAGSILLLLGVMAAVKIARAASPSARNRGAS